MKIFKFGGASVKDANGVKNILNVLKNTGFDNTLIVVSAMGHTTDELTAKARAINSNPPQREMDMLLSTGDFITLMDDEEPFMETVRYRTVGDMSCTGAVESSADTIDKIIDEVAVTRITERGATRADDRVSEAAMEDRKKEGYF